MRDSTGSDEELLDRVRQAPDGDLQAFEQLVQRYQPKVVANCRYLTRNAGYAEDLAQEVFVKAYFGMARFEGRSSFHTWLQRIKINHCLNYLKKQEGKAFVDVEDETVKYANELVLQPVAEMDQLPYEEVAEALGISLSAVKMRIKRGRENFRRRYR